MLLYEPPICMPVSPGPGRRPLCPVYPRGVPHQPGLLLRLRLHLQQVCEPVSLRKPVRTVCHLLRAEPQRQVHVSAGLGGQPSRLLLSQGGALRSGS